MGINLVNLRKLRNGINRRIISGVINQKTFDMVDFRRGFEVFSSCDFVSKKDCGTVGCLLGWAPMIKGLECDLQDFGKSYIGEAKNYLIWSSYCDRVLSIGTDSGLWDFLFSHEWANFDNTPEGAVARMDVVLMFPDLMDGINE